MTRFVRLAAMMLLSAILVPPAAGRDDEAVDQRSFTCPLNDRTFTQDVGYSAFPLITLPDGSWLGDTEIGVQIPVCPDNGLVLIPDLSKSSAEAGDDRILYADYSAAERTRLPALIADPEYAALQADGRYAQAYWLASRLERPAEDRFFMLQRSTWATRDPVLRKKLVARFAAEAPALIDAFGGAETKRRYHRIYVVNALRELGRFNEALAMLDSIEKSGPPVPGQPDPDSIYGPGEAAGPMRRALIGKDDGRFAAELLPKKMVSQVCENRLAAMYGPTTPATLAACKARRERETRESRALEQEFDEARNWQGKPEERDAKCAATADAPRSRGLQRACDEAQDLRDKIAGLDLASQPEKLAVDCAATPETDHAGPMQYACEDFDRAVGDQLGDLLIGDDAAYRLMCVFETGDPDVGPPDRSAEARDACWHAKMGRAAAAVEAQMADLPALDARCKVYGDRYDDEVLNDACRERAQLLMEKDARRLFENKAAFDAECGQFRSKMTDGWITDGEKERACRSAWELQTGRAIRLPNDPAPAGPTSKAPGAASKETGNEIMDIVMRRIDATKANAPLQSVARKQAEAIVTKAKLDGTYPKRKPGDRF